MRCGLSLLICCLFIVCYPSSGDVRAQVGNLPEVEIVTDNFDYMISLFPDDYPDYREALKACSTVAPLADSIAAFWEEQGEAVLYYLSYFSGIDWMEPEFKIYLVKYYPDYANHDPLTIPLAGKKQGDRIEALPGGLSPYLTLFQQLSRRLLEQTEVPGAVPYFIAGHPLLQKTPRRFNVMADLLALSVIKDFVDIDSVMTLYKSDQWKRRALGQEVLFEYFWDQWPLSADSTLAFRIASEPYSSRLVSVTRPPVTRKPQHSGWGNHQLQAPPGGRLGFSVARDRSGFYRVVEIDTLKLGYVSGLRLDDLVRNVDGVSPRNIKQLYTMILDNLEAGVHVNIVREELPDAVIIYPWLETE